MSATTCMGIPNVERVLFKELFPGDYDKFQGVSNIAPTGGGARDLRFSGVVPLTPVIHAMFPVPVPSQRKRIAGPNVDVFQGKLRWPGGAMDVVMEPFQDERDNEWRLAQVASMPPFAGRQEPPGCAPGHREMLVLLQDVSGNIWPVIDWQAAVMADPSIGAFVGGGFCSSHPCRACRCWLHGFPKRSELGQVAARCLEASASIGSEMVDE